MTISRGAFAPCSPPDAHVYTWNSPKPGSGSNKMSGFRLASAYSTVKVFVSRRSYLSHGCMCHSERIRINTVMKVYGWGWMRTWGIQYIKLKKTYRFEKKEYIGSTAQKKSNKITKFLINAFLLSVEATFHKNALIKNLVILFDFFCAVEPIYSFFSNR